MFALSLQNKKIKFDHGYVMLENLLIEFYAKSSLGQIKQKGDWQECVCLSLSNESLVTTIGELLSLVWFHGENRSP